MSAWTSWRPSGGRLSLTLSPGWTASTLRATPSPPCARTSICSAAEGDEQPRGNDLLKIARRFMPPAFQNGGLRASGSCPLDLHRVERAKLLLQGELSLAEVAAHAGFSDQSQFTHHFKRLVGVTPGQFRTPARTA